MQNRLCFEVKNGSFPIQLRQQGKDRFTVIYGLQVHSNLRYGQAASKLGEAIMHKLACDGDLDNRERGER